MAFQDSREWRLGDNAQRDWAKIMGESGRIAIPVYGAESNALVTKAPMLFFMGGMLVAPDVLVMTPAKNFWHEVKAKAVPTWRRCHPGPRWEHGIDFALIEEYETVQAESGADVFIIVWEEHSPTGNPRSGEDFRQYLRGDPEWLAISIAAAIKHGEHRKDWPKRNGNPSDLGRNGQGGLLWSRSAMKQIDMNSLRQ